MLTHLEQCIFGEAILYTALLTKKKGAGTGIGLGKTGLSKVILAL
jgi:hypothetical protein